MMLSLCFSLIAQIPAALRKQVAGIGVTGQMHGILLADQNFQPVTNLVNWQDRRCSVDFPEVFEKVRTNTGYQLSDGYGFATLLWFLNSPKGIFPENAAHCATVQDLLVHALTQSAKIIMDTSTAASWGFFNPATQQWDLSAIESTGIPTKMLPSVIPCGAIAGGLDPGMAEKLGMNPGIPVTAAIGDNQASLLGTLKNPETEIALTLGTGGQVSVVVDGLIEEKTGETTRHEKRPFVRGKTALVGAAMCGGNAWEWLAKWIQNIVEVLEGKATMEKIYEKMDSEGLKSTDELTVKPHFLGERYDKTLTGIVSGISLENTSLGSLSKGLARGIIRNLKSMIPPEALKNRQKVVGSGNALRRTKLLQKMVEEEFGLPLTILDTKEEAAVGAAINVYNACKKS